MDAYDKNGKLLGSSLMVHRDMEAAVGESLAAFAEPMVSKCVVIDLYTVVYLFNYICVLAYIYIYMVQY